MDLLQKLENKEAQSVKIVNTNNQQESNENIILYKCLEGFHRRFIEADSSPELRNLSAFTEMMQGDYSGENLIAKVISTNEHWEKMLNTKGFGRGVKYNKAQAYREGLITASNTVIEIFSTRNEAKISKLMGLLLWDLEADEFTHSYLGVIEEAIKQNKLWRNPVVSDIFCSFFGFVKGPFKTLEEIASEHKLDRERVRQLKVQCLERFEQDFWFIKDDLIKEKIQNLFDLAPHKLEQINEQTEQVNRDEGINFTKEFYTIILPIVSDVVLIGNINDIKIQNKRSSFGNVWSNLYLQTQQERIRCNLEGLVDALAKVMHNHQYHFENDKELDLAPYITVPLSDNEIERYNSIIAVELELKTELKSNKAIIKRNSLITQPEMVEAALRELGGFAYADDILDKVTEIYPDKGWSMSVLRASFLRKENFYSVGKSGLFGLKDVKDVSEEMGDGTLNEIIQILLSREYTPVHIHSLLEHINTLFPRPKTLRTVHTILEQNSKVYFKKFDGGFYGLKKKDYENTDFPRVVGAHGVLLRQIIDESEGVSFEEAFITFNERFGLLEIQVKYLLDQMIETNRVRLINGLYHCYSGSTIQGTGENDESATSADVIDVDIDQEELDFEELNQPDISDKLANDAVAQIKVRRGQPRFRQKLLKFYKRTCIVTGCKIPELLEAAHVLPYSQQKDFSLSNGLLLRADIHTLFDLSMIAIDPESMRLKLSAALIKSSEYTDLNNIDIGSRLTELHQAYKISKEGLYRRWESFIESE